MINWDICNINTSRTYRLSAIVNLKFMCAKCSRGEPFKVSFHIQKRLYTNLKSKHEQHLLKNMTFLNQMREKTDNFWNTFLKTHFKHKSRWNSDKKKYLKWHILKFGPFTPWSRLGECTNRCSLFWELFTYRYYVKKEAFWKSSILEALAP